MEDIKKMIRNIPDFPKKGIIFRDITTAVKDPETMKKIIDYIKMKKLIMLPGLNPEGLFLACPLHIL